MNTSTCFSVKCILTFVSHTAKWLVMLEHLEKSWVEYRKILTCHSLKQILKWKEEARKKHCFLKKGVYSPKLELTQAPRHLVPLLPYFSNQLRLNTPVALNFVNSLSGSIKSVLGFRKGKRSELSIW